MESLNSNNLAVAVLAGGQSTRMGQDKGLMDFDGKPMVAAVLEVAKTLTSEVFIVSSEESYLQFGLPCLNDLRPNGGPMTGLEAALHFSSSERLLLLPCDMPLLDASLLSSFLAALPDGMGGMLSWKGQAFPMPGIYLRSWLPHLQEALDNGFSSLYRFNLAMKGLLIEAESLTGFHPDKMLNFNSQEELNGYWDEKQKGQ